MTLRQTHRRGAILMVLAAVSCATATTEIAPTSIPEPTGTPLPMLAATPTVQAATWTPTPGATAQLPSPTTPTSRTPAETPLPVTPTADSWPTPETPVILSFTAESMEAGPGESVTVTWESSGATHAAIEFGESFQAVPTSGTTTVVVDEDRRHDLRLGLVVSNDVGGTAHRSVTIRLRCPYSYFFEPAPTGWARCPYRPAGFSWAAGQTFEEGRMIWLQEIPAESTRAGGAEGPVIYVLYEDGRFPQWQRFEDTWVTGEPECAPSIVPPEGLYQPIRGFGKLWRDNVEVRKRLGWAVEHERGFNGAYQIAWEPDYESDGAYLRTLEGRVVVLSVLGIWDFVGP